MSGYRELASDLPPLDGLLELFRKWSPCNIGMVVPRWMVVVEADSPEGEAEIVSLSSGATDSTPARERRVGRGRGWLFGMVDAEGIPTGSHLGQSKAIDVLSAGSIFVIPHSVHRTGHRYEWVAHQAPWESALQLLPAPIVRLRLDSRDRAHPDVQAPRDFTPGVSGRVSFLLASRAGIRRLWNGEGKKRGDTSQSGVDYALACALSDAKVPVKEIAEALAVRPGVHRSTPEYCMRTACAADRRSP